MPYRYRSTENRLMKKKELSRMRRTELISLVRAQKRENERLKKRLDRKSSYDNRDGSLRKSDTADRYIRIARNTAMVLITAAAAAVLIATLLLPVFRIYGSSMTPTLEEGNIVISVRGGEYRQGDIISFYYNNKILVKRVIALPGDWVDIDDAGNVYVNDELLDEPYVQDKALGECDIELPYQVPEGRLFVCGDHRSTSVDSRSSTVGCVAEEQIAGKIVYRIWPLTDVGPVG